MLEISSQVAIPDHEIELSAVRSQGAGGQNVNKVATAIHLRFNIPASSLPEFYKERLLQLNDNRITKDGVIVLKAQQHRTQEANKLDALERLRSLIQSAAIVPKARKPTKPTRAARQKRIESKLKRAKIKAHRQKVDPD